MELRPHGWNTTRRTPRVTKTRLCGPGDLDVVCRPSARPASANAGRRTARAGREERADRRQDPRGGVEASGFVERLRRARLRRRRPVARRASAGRAEKGISGVRLTMPAPARVFRGPALNQLGNQVVRSAVAKQRLRGPPRLRCLFRTDAARWPHRAPARQASIAAARSVSDAAKRSSEPERSSRVAARGADANLERPWERGP